MESSYLMSKGKALEAFPMLKQDDLVGAIVYYDGMFLTNKHRAWGCLKKLIRPLTAQGNTMIHG